MKEKSSEPYMIMGEYTYKMLMKGIGEIWRESIKKGDIMERGDKITFNYKSKKKIVLGIVTHVDNKSTVCLLLNDYRGKNDYWCAGEIKEFNRSEMKNIKVGEVR
jgi:hypothetical protein